MKKFLTIILAVLLACGVFSLIACGGDGGKGKETGSITVTPASCEIDINQQLQLSAKFLDGAGNEIAGKAFTWESEDDAVATVTNEGLVTGIGVGNVKIFAKSGEISGYCDLTVIDSGEVPVLSYMGPDSVKLNIGDVYTLTAYVRYKNEDVAAQISFENSAPEIVSIATDGAKAELTAVDAGTAVITIKSAYNGVALSKEFTLQVLEKTVRQIDSRFIVDLSKDTVAVDVPTSDFLQEYDTTVSAITIGDGENVLSSIENGRATLIKSKLKAGEQTIKFETDRIVYEAQIKVCSKIITTEEEFKNIQSFYRATPVGNQLRWNGYVLLANDLDLQNEFETTESNVPFRVVESNSDAGLVGTFDGGGHTIKNFKVGVRGLFGAIGANGVVKDVSFIDVSTAADDGGIIAYFNYGSMSNVFVSASLTAMNPYGNGPGVLAHITSAETMFTRCVIEMTATPGAGKTDWGVIGHHTNMSQKLLEGTYSDIIVIGGTQVIPAGYTCSGLDSDTVKGYATLADYWADPNRNDASLWEGGMWQANSNQMPVLKTYGSNLLDNLTISPEAKTEIKDGDVISTNRDSEVKFMLKTEVAGVSIDETTGVVTIDDDSATNGSTFTVVVYSRLDETVYTERQYTIKCLAATFATGKQVNVDLSENADYELSFATVTDGTHTLSGEIVEVRLGTTVLTKDTDYTISDGKITFKQSVLQNIGTGLKQVRVITEQENNLNAYTIDLLLCSKIIRTVEEFKNIESYFTKSAVGEQFRWDGYVLLADDLDLQNGFETTESNVPFRVVNFDLNCGLMGTFDGGGHTVKNFKVGVRGLFGAIGANGVVKNVSFIGVSTAAGDGGIIAYFNNGTMQDIFVSASLPNDINPDGNGPGVLAHVVSAQTKFTRCVIEMTATPGAGKTDWGVIGHHTNMSQKLLEGTYSDIIVIGGTQVIPAGYTCSGLDSDTVKGYATLADYWADPNRNDASSWEGGMWQATNGEMPALK